MTDKKNMNRPPDGYPKNFEDLCKMNLALGFDGKPRWFNKEGIPLISMDEVEALLRNEEYKIVKQDKVGKYFISTVWLGLDHSSFRAPFPLIFETMIFSQEEGKDELDSYMRRYYTLQQAQEGHEIICDLVRIFGGSVE